MTGLFNKNKNDQRQITAGVSTAFRSMVLGLAAVGLLGVAGLQVGCQMDKVSEQDASQDPLLAVRFNASDGQQVAKTAIDHLSTRSFFLEYKQSEGRKPVVVVGDIIDEAYPPVSTQFITGPIEEYLVNDSDARVVSNKQYREVARSERLDTEYINADLVKKIRNELAADYILVGKITNDKERAINKNSKTKEAVVYLVNLRLIDAETAEVVWINPQAQSMVRKDYGK